MWFSKDQVCVIYDARNWNCKGQHVFFLNGDSAYHELNAKVETESDIYDNKKKKAFKNYGLFYYRVWWFFKILPHFDKLCENGQEGRI